MSNLSRFFKGNVHERKNKKIVVSDRFTEEDGTFVEWEIKSISSQEYDKLIKDNTYQKDGVETLNDENFAGAFLGKTVVFPNLNDKELQDSYGVMSVYDLLSQMLLPGEVSYLTNEVRGLCGFDRSQIEAKIKKAKN